MIGVYFSGTGNSKYCVEKFMQEYDTQAMTFSIEDNELLNQIDGINLIIVRRIHV